MVVKVLFWSFETNTAVLIGGSVFIGFVLFLFTLLFKSKKHSSEVIALRKIIEDLNSQLAKLPNKEGFKQEIEEDTTVAQAFF